MATPTSKAGDLTGRQRASAAKKAQEEQAQREQELTMASIAKEIALTNEVVDYTGGAAPDEEPEDEILEPVSDLTVTSDVDLADISVVTQKYKTIRVNEAIKDMTFGAGNYFTFEVGPKYKVTEELANHLDRLGYVWH